VICFVGRDSATRANCVGKKESLYQLPPARSTSSRSGSNIGARGSSDTYRGYNGYVLERNDRRIVFGGDTALSDSFAVLRAFGPIDLAIMPIGAYNPWIHSHCTLEQAVHMANEAGALVMPVHHQTFRLNSEGFREPIERFQAALRETPERIALREIGETFVLP
jgi:L-ascorbate metabolism protein UlaG (beta-lactamase superfamily)